MSKRADNEITEAEKEDVHVICKRTAAAIAYDKSLNVNTTVKGIIAENEKLADISQTVDELGVLVEVEDKRAADVLIQVYGDIQELSSGVEVFYTGAFGAGVVSQRMDASRKEFDKHGWEVVEIKSVIRWYLFTKYKKTVRSNVLIISANKRDLKM
ncbi:hypothetical protein MP228_010477 [Amoeboaphelidium protococcarum]|nr:hypothetical protein MP228_010477 [Amoeboaphelidium protococcarum]